MAGGWLRRRHRRGRSRRRDLISNAATRRLHARAAGSRAARTRDRALGAPPAGARRSGGSLRRVPSATFDRSGAVQRLRNEDFDVLVVGGGITGAGVALDAVSRGLRTALVERDDFASGTSSRSSKLVHGGLRYLDQREFRLVYEALAERQRIIENAPHLVSILPFLVPVLRSGGRIDRRLAPVLGGALWMYDLTGGLRIGRRHRRVSADEALAHIPTLDRSQLARVRVLRRPGRRRVADARDRPHRRRARRGRRQPCRRDRVREARWNRRRCARLGRWRRPDRAGARAGERFRRVGRRRARPRRGCAPCLDAAREGRAHHAAVVDGAQPDRRHRSRARR